MWYEPHGHETKKMNRLEGELSSHEVNHLPGKGERRHVVRLVRQGATFIMSGGEAGMTLFPKGSKVVLHAFQDFPTTETEGEHSVLGMEVVDEEGRLIAFTRASAGYVLRVANGDQPGEMIVPANGTPIPESAAAHCCL